MSDQNTLDDEPQKPSLAEAPEAVNNDDLIDITNLDEVDEIDLTEEQAPETDLAIENGELKDRLMRALADAENQRKRGERDRRDAEIYGGRKLARDILTVYDFMKRAVESATDEQREANKSLFEGLDLTQKEIISVFAKHQITVIAPQPGDDFDPEVHQAMFEAPHPDFKGGKIIQTIDEGFMIADRLLRPANVGVSAG